jgi:hypothetical protein
MADQEKQNQSGDSGSDAPANKDVTPAGAQPPNPPADTNVDQNASPSDQFKQEQSAQAALQNLRGEGAVPEQRPQAFQSPTAEDTESRTHLALKEAGDPLVATDPMPKSAYDKAASKNQMKEAAKESRSPTIREGYRVRLKDIGKGWDGRNAVILSVNYPTDQHQLRELGTPESMYAEPESFIIRTRDGRTDTREVKPDQVEPVDPADWGRSGI